MDRPPRTPTHAARVERLAALAGLGWAAALLVASVTAPPDGSLAPPGPIGLVGLDRWVHAVGYGVLAALVVLARGRAGPRAVAAAVLLAATYGGAIELVQATLPERTAALGDAAANAAGATLGVFLGVAAERIGGAVRRR